MMKLESLTLNSLNARGLGDNKKRRCIFQWLKQFHEGITFLQETHTTQGVENKWKNEWGSRIEFSHGTYGSRGVAILFPKRLDVCINHKIVDNDGRFILLDLIIEDIQLTLVNIYAPTKDNINAQLEFIDNIQNILDGYQDKNIIVG